MDFIQCGSKEILSNTFTYFHHYLNAQMHIENATDFYVNISMGGSPGFGPGGLENMIKVKEFQLPYTTPRNRN